MSVSRVWAAYFSPTGTTQAITCAIVDHIAHQTGAEKRRHNFTLPEARTKTAVFDSRDLVVFGTPVYAGRIPNVLLPYLATLQGNGARAVPLVVYGNRDFDDALVESRDILYKNGFLPVAAAAFVGEHSFSTCLAAGRPDARDMDMVKNFADVVCAKTQAPNTPDSPEPVQVAGTPFPYRGYYKPRDRQGNFIDIRKVKPLVDRELCMQCGLCATVCPMGSISREDVSAYTGICIKCGACIKKCPAGARYYDDPGYLYHKKELEEVFTRRAKPAFFF